MLHKCLLALPNPKNSVVCAGRDVQVKWKQLTCNDSSTTAPAAAAKGSHQDENGTIVFAIHGYAMAAVEFPSHPLS